MGATDIGRMQNFLFEKVAAEDLQRVPAAAQNQLAERAIRHLAIRRAGDVNLDIFPGSEVGLPEVTILEVINDDRPFLLGSTLAELNDRGINPGLVAHPILRVERAQSGAIKGQAEAATPDARGSRESLIHIHLPRLSATESDALFKALHQVFDHVSQAVHDFLPMRDRLQKAIADYRRTPPPLDKLEVKEAIAFMEWLAADHMTLLGIREYALQKGDASPQAEQGTGLGILRDPDVQVLRSGRKTLAMTPEILAFLKEPQALIITKANVKSLVHRRVHMDYIGIKIFDTKGQISGELRLVGLLTATAYNDPVSSIPYIRRKAAVVFERAGLASDSHSGRALINVLESYPRDEMFQISEHQLEAFARDILALGDRPRLRVLPRIDRFDRFVSILVYVPKDRYDSEIRRKIGLYLAEQYSGRLSAAYPSYPEGPLTRTHYIIGRDEGKTPVVERNALEAGIATIIRTWGDNLREASLNNPLLEPVVAKYTDRFDAAYRDTFSASETIADMAIMERLSASHNRMVSLHKKVDTGSQDYALKVFSLGSAVALSERVPILEGLGFKALSERTYKISASNAEANSGIWLHDMALESVPSGASTSSVVTTTPSISTHGIPAIETALMAVFDGSMESDRLNALVLQAGLSWRDVAMLRTLSRYAQQIGTPYGQDYIADTMKKHAGITAAMVALFHIRFDPAAPDKGRSEREKTISLEIDGLLTTVESLDEDRILRLFRELILASVRTNFYQRDETGNHRQVIAFKFEAAKISSLPLPRPLFEIFMHSPRVEGVHMRFGKVARGGIRWSDRPQDFRTEVLGLVKAQQVKNAVIVPVGAKGGFVPKKLPPATDRAAWLAEGTESYKIFIATLLTLTDNIIDTRTMPPPNTIRHDSDDPYLVVAADKGTATFSDIANGISQAHNHWLGDAFASGGSVGYDHKKMGITARGAWEAVKRHFREIDIDIQKSPFTVAGVGDMSGDVFGNGMLLSPEIRLVAAFDHRDIFIDPTPDAALSLTERQRLFSLPRSSWQDYDKSLISAGGGIFPRSAKMLTLTPQIQALLDLSSTTASPQEVMNAILKIRVDLMWFGGIGTYIRASTETDADAGDRANNAIRITGQDLRCKVIGEGANLGLTQRGRIEAARSGIRLNTDAIDNSAGVNSSDVEVNIKIALSRPMTDGRMTYDIRNPLLASMTDDVARLVLRNNYLQSLAISLTQAKGVADIADERRLMRQLEKTGMLDRRVEFLPPDAMLDTLEKQGKGLTRPELSVLLAYAKLAFHDDILASKVPDDPYFAVELYRYFPETIQKQYPDAIEGHRLRREIIATGLANAVINRTGPSAAIRLSQDTGRPVEDVARAYALTRDAFGILDINTMIDALDTKVSGDIQLSLYEAVQAFTIKRMLWFMRHVDFKPGLSALVKRFKTETSGLPQSRQDNPWLTSGVPESLATRIAILSELASLPDSILVGEISGAGTARAQSAIAMIESSYLASRIRDAINSIIPDDSLERRALMQSGDQLDAAIRDMAISQLKAEAGQSTAFEQTLNGTGVQRTIRTIEEALSGQPSLSRVAVAVGTLMEHARK
jgi:glutamate dehydrogenase